MAGKAFVLRIKPGYIDRVDEALASDQLIIGWSDAEGLLDPNLDPDDFKRILQEVYHPDGEDRRAVGQNAPHLWRFIREMSEGDLVVVPHDSDAYFARVLSGRPTYEPGGPEGHGGYVRPVTWLNNKQPISIETLSPDLKAEIAKTRQTSRDASALYNEIAALTAQFASEGDWTADELDAVVSDYRAMLRDELSGVPYNKSGHRRALQAHVRRSEGSIEFKHQNISAVLEEIGLPWIKGYKPRHNYQTSLVAVVERYFAEPTEALPPTAQPDTIPDLASVFVPPPQKREANDAPPAPTIRLARKIDQAARDQRNRELGDDGEKYVFDLEKKKLSHLPKLAHRVSWDSKVLGDGLGYDIKSFDVAGNKLLIEVKTTRGGIRTPFYMSASELRAASELGAGYRIYRVFDFGKTPRIFELRAPLEEVIDLTPSAYEARPK